jgi:adenylate cyclase
MAVGLASAMIQSMSPGDNDTPAARDADDLARDDADDLAREIGAPREAVATIQTLQGLGVSAQAIRRAHERGRIEDAIFDAVLDPHRDERTVSATEIEADGGLGVDETRLIALSFGIGTPEPQEPFFTPAEAKVLVRLGELREIWPPEVFMQVARVYNQALAHIAQTEVNLFRLYVEPTLRTAAGGKPAGLAAVHEAFGQLLPLADPLLLGVHRRSIEHELTQAAVREAERRNPAGILPGSIEVTFLFCDLKDFSAYADTHGDAAAADLIERFAVTVTERGEHGHVIKALGDGFMLSYSEPGPAVADCLGIIERMRGGGAPGVHASVHHGIALYREGDYFGQSVNLAARLLGLAGRDELLASDAVVRATEGQFDWEPRGSHTIRGFGEPVDVYRLAAT